MKKMILVVAMVLMSNYASAVCTTPISRTNFSAFQVLTSISLNAQLNTAYTQLNELPGDCITTNTMSGLKILDNTITNAKISASAAIAPSKLAAPNYTISTDSGSFTTTSNTPVDVTNLTATITTTGKPVEIFLISKESASDIGTIQTNRGSTNAQGVFAVLKGATTISRTSLYTEAVGASAVDITSPCSSVRYIDVPAAGTYTYKIQAHGVVLGTTVNITYCRLVVREL